MEHRVNHPQYLVTEGNDHSLVAPTSHERLVFPFKLALGLTRGVGDLAEDLAQHPIAFTRPSVFMLRRVDQ